jgi:hypothetical protein
MIRRFFCNFDIYNIFVHFYLIFVLFFQVVRILVSPDNPQQATTGAQKMMNQSGKTQKYLWKYLV